ncbi:hypothetical protein [Rhodanobacter sp. Soil772]|uniref:hypothetical protein n=1 Tax=Rhodanobacter sp. Soil772 TaxID=1736406 RepID=UPI0012F88EB9|nr:hypothetical protein [Rhodanobacter sp. Soil772]
MKTLPILLLLLFHVALAESTPADTVSCRLSAYDVEQYARTLGRSSRETRLSEKGSCRIDRSKHGLSLEAIPSMTPPTLCRFVIFGDSSLGKGWQIQAFAIETTSNGLHRTPPNVFKLRADDPERVEQALITTVTFRGPDCKKWHDAFEPTTPTGDPTP